MWNSISLVTGGLTLIAFIVAVISTIIISRLAQQKNLIETAPEQERAKLVEQALERFHVDTSNLTKERQYVIAMEQIRGRSKQHGQTLTLIGFLAIIMAITTAFAIYINSLGPQKVEPIAPITVPNGFTEYELPEIRAAIALPNGYFRHLHLFSYMFRNDENSIDSLITIGSAQGIGADCDPENFEFFVEDLIPSLVPEGSELEMGEVEMEPGEVVIDIKDPELVPMIGFKSLEVEVGIKPPGDGTPFNSIIRFICDEGLDKFIFLLYPNTEQGKTIISTLYFEPN